ncbi:hypothetical protein V491_07849 [Pseudogymnoascus sp. VKM F-3775]|nr:hypothetical protein V491_07849 [Pseudogymnoascus sp. VKM F-3775]
MAAPVLFADIGNVVFNQPNALAGIALVQPTITVERDERDDYHISARFILESTVVEPQPMPKRNWHFLDSIRLDCQSHESDVCLPESNATPTMKITSTESQGWQAGGGGTAGPTPGLNVNFSIVGNTTVTRDTQTGSWSLVAFKSIGYNSWRWQSKTKTLGYVPDDVKLSTRRAITVTRTLPVATVDAAVGPLVDISFKVEKCTNSDPERGFHRIWNHGVPAKTFAVNFTLRLDQSAKKYLPPDNTIRLDEQLASLIALNKSILPGSLVDHIQRNDPTGRRLTRSKSGVAQILTV